MPFILIALGDSGGDEFAADKVASFIDQILVEDIRIPQRGRSGRQPLPQPRARKCHVMNKAWIVEVNQLRREMIVKFLEQMLPNSQPFIVAPLSDTWLARNGALAASKCFSY